MEPRPPRPDYRVLSVRTIALAALMLVLVGVGVAAWLLVAFGNGTTQSANRLDAIKTAGTIVVGTGGAGALWLAARRQRTSELALRQKDLDHAKVDRAYELQERVAAASDADAAERRVTDLYTRAADQLGSDKAPVRLAGMYALERLGQSAPDQRQTIVHVLCAYLRMPYAPPEPNGTTPDGRSEDGDTREQERQVRLTAQRILAAHLRPLDDSGQGDPRFWSDIDLDLTGATLLDWNLAGCVVRSVECVDTRFAGASTFRDIGVLGAARFDGAAFEGKATFTNATFSGIARFSLARFWQKATFDDAHFRADAPFSAARFDMDGSFSRTVFEQGARFGSTTFGRDALFNGTRFAGPTRFGRTEFQGTALFDGVRFEHETRFDDAEFGTLVEFKNTWFGGYVEFSGARFEGDTRFSKVRFADSVRFATTRFSGDAQFDSTWVRLDVPKTVARAWPASIARAWPGRFVVLSGEPSADPVPDGDADGYWGLLSYVRDPAGRVPD